MSFEQQLQLEQIRTDYIHDCMDCCPAGASSFVLQIAEMNAKHIALLSINESNMHKYDKHNRIV